MESKNKEKGTAYPINTCACKGLLKVFLPAFLCCSSTLSLRLYERLYLSMEKSYSQQICFDIYYIVFIVNCFLLAYPINSNCLSVYLYVCMNVYISQSSLKFPLRDFCLLCKSYWPHCAAFELLLCLSFAENKCLSHALQVRLHFECNAAHPAGFVATFEIGLGLRCKLTWPAGSGELY